MTELSFTDYAVRGLTLEELVRILITSPQLLPSGLLPNAVSVDPVYGLQQILQQVAYQITRDLLTNPGNSSAKLEIDSERVLFNFQTIQGGWTIDDQSYNFWIYVPDDASLEINEWVQKSNMRQRGAIRTLTIE